MNDKIAEILTLDTTYLFQFRDFDGSAWHFYSQTEYRTEEFAREAAQNCYGGVVPYRIVKIERSIID